MYEADFKAKTWQYVVEHYKHLASLHPSFEPMCDFVSQIAASEYSEGIFPATSMYRLLISQNIEFDWHHEVLEIDFNPAAQIFRFEYWEHPVHAIKRWIKECDADAGFAVFERFLQLKKWFA